MGCVYVQQVLTWWLACWSGPRRLPSRFPKSPPFGLYDGFETDAIGPFWIPGGEKYQRYVKGHVTVQSEVVRSEKYAANITVESGDIQQGNSERDELDSRTWAVLDEDVWYGWSQFLPKDFPIVDDRYVAACCVQLACVCWE